MSCHIIIVYHNKVNVCADKTHLRHAETDINEGFTNISIQLMADVGVRATLGLLLYLEQQHRTVGRDDARDYQGTDAEAVATINEGSGEIEDS